MTLYRGRLRKDPRIVDLGHRCSWVISLTLRLFYPRKPSDSVSRSSYWRVEQKRLWDRKCSSTHKDLRIFRFSGICRCVTGWSVPEFSEDYSALSSLVWSRESASYHRRTELSTTLLWKPRKFHTGVSWCLASFTVHTVSLLALHTMVVRYYIVSAMFVFAKILFFSSRVSLIEPCSV